MSEITVYTTPTCPWCHKVKEYFDDQGVPYQEVDVSADDSAAEKLYQMTGQLSVPVTTKGEEVIVGFDPERLGKLTH